MHELGRYVQSLMDSEGMTQADLARRSGLSRQHVHSMLKAEKLTRLPAGATIDGLHKAFPHVTREAFVLRAAAAMGIPVDATLAEPDYSSLSDDALLGILKKRLDGGSNEGRQPEDQKTPNPDSGGAGITRLSPKHQRMVDEAQMQEQAAYDGAGKGD